MTESQAWKILETMDPMVPTLLHVPVTAPSLDYESYRYPRSLRDDIAEHGRDGTKKLPTVRRWLDILMSNP